MAESKQDVIDLNKKSFSLVRHEILQRHGGYFVLC